MRNPVILVGLCLVACGPSDRITDTHDVHDAGGATDGPAGGGGARLTGTVWAPANAPGMVPAGQEIPVSGAIVYLSTEKPAPIPQRVECTECSEAPSYARLSDARGRFELRAAAGRYWLVVQKAQFRIETLISMDESTGEVGAELEIGVCKPDSGVE